MSSFSMSSLSRKRNTIRQSINSLKDLLGSSFERSLDTLEPEENVEEKKANLLVLKDINALAKKDSSQALVELEKNFPGSVQYVQDSVRTKTTQSPDWKKLSSQEQLLRKKNAFSIAVSSRIMNLVNANAITRKLTPEEAQRQAEEKRLQVMEDWKKQRSMTTLRRPLRSVFNDEDGDSPDTTSTLEGGRKRRLSSSKRTKRSRTKKGSKRTRSKQKKRSSRKRKRSSNKRRRSKR